ncbi:hypothetical protein M1432_00385 [Patescibacteria group bacterium]|nr:hypothetical protein [Patescibacteria group bacterium]
MKHVLRFRAINKDIWLAIKAGRKKIETRAATVKYENIQAGDKIEFVCGKGRFSKTAKRVVVYKSIAAIVRAYGFKAINPKVDSAKELRELYYTFPGYRDKIKKKGLIAIELK